MIIIFFIMSSHKLVFGYFIKILFLYVKKKKKIKYRDVLVV